MAAEGTPHACGSTLKLKLAINSHVAYTQPLKVLFQSLIARSGASQRLYAPRDVHLSVV